MQSDVGDEYEYGIPEDQEPHAGLKRAKPDPGADTCEADPGLIIIYGNDQIIHDALGQAGAPIPQGATPAASADSFKEFVFTMILGTPIDIEFNCLEKATVGGVPEVSHTLFQSLTHDQYRKVLARLTRTFITSGTPTALWSMALGHALGMLVTVTGGGTGGVYYTKVSMDDGVFRSS